MSYKLTISCEADLAEVELEEGLTVQIMDSGKIITCITGYEGQLIWQTLASSRLDFPEAQPQLQEIEFEETRSESKARGFTLTPVQTYLH